MKRYASPFVLVLMIALAAGCGDDGASSPSTTAPAGPIQSVDAAIARWAASRVDSYAIEIAQTGFMPSPRVQSAQIDGAKVSSSAGTPLTFLTAPTVEGLFAFLKAPDQVNAAEVRVTYDEALGYPKTIFVDYDRRIADEEMHLAVAVTPRAR